VGQIRIKYLAPAKIIVYSGIKAQADILGEELGCIVYYTNISHREEKEKQLGRWIQGSKDDQVVVATNTLGLGINSGDTQAVIHMTMPEDLAGYV
jgi:superfamily II DNA helicase RecQ